MERYHWGFEGMVDDEDGNYVEHHDAAAALAARDQRIAELCEALAQRDTMLDARDNRLAAQAALLQRAEAALERRTEGCDSSCACWGSGDAYCVRCKWDEDQGEEEEATLAAIRAAREGGA